MTPSYAVPAGVLDALGGLVDGDPRCEAISRRFIDNDDRPMRGPLLSLGNGRSAMALRMSDHSYSVHNDRVARVELLLPQSAPALAAVVARRLGLDPSGGVLVEQSEGHLILRCLVGSRSFMAPRVWRKTDVVPGLDDAANAMHALALVACHLANQAVGEDRFAPREVTQ